MFQLWCLFHVPIIEVTWDANEVYHLQAIVICIIDLVKPQWQVSLNESVKDSSENESKKEKTVKTIWLVSRIVYYQSARCALQNMNGPKHTWPCETCLTFDNSKLFSLLQIALPYDIVWIALNYPFHESISCLFFILLFVFYLKGNHFLGIKDLTKPLNGISGELRDQWSYMTHLAAARYPFESLLSPYTRGNVVGSRDG